MNKTDKVWELHKSIYRHLKKRAKSLEGEVSKELIQYDKNQRKYASREFEQSSMEELFEKINNGHVVYLGDFHSFDQNSRNLERLIRNLIKQKETFSLGVEFVDQKHQDSIDHYLARNITELEFLESIDYHESWRFPWVYYRPFFAMARENNVPVLALNSQGGLKARDQKAADKIESFFKNNPDSRLLVLFGELHIVKNKLPEMVKKKLTPLIEHYRDVIIHQNLDEVYWKLHEIHIEKHNQIIKFEENEFAILSAPPWIKYESMIYWYENLADSPELEINDYLLNEGVLYLNSNVPENFLFLCEKIRETLEIEDKIESYALEDFNLYEHQNLEVVSEKISTLPKQQLVTFYERLLTEGRVFRIPKTSSYYCSSYSINRMAQLAGMHLEHLIHEKQGHSDDLKWIHSKNFEKLITIIKTNAIGFLSSKMINPYRKCDLYGDIVIQIDLLLKSEFKDTQKINILNLAKECIEFKEGQSLAQILKGKSLFIIHEVARKIGFYLGEIIYEEFLMKRSQELNPLIDYLFSSSLCEKEFKVILRKVLPESEYPLHRKRYF
jgi:hypothetical protein